VSLRAISAFTFYVYLFRAKAKFFWQKPAAKLKNMFFFLFLLKEKTKIHSVQRDEVPKISFLLIIIIRWGESGKANLNETLLIQSIQCKQIHACWQHAIWSG